MVPSLPRAWWGALTGTSHRLHPSIQGSLPPCHGVCCGRRRHRQETTCHKKPVVCAWSRTLLRIARSSSGGSNLANQPRTGWTGPLLVERPATSQMAPSNSSPPAFC